MSKRHFENELRNVNNDEVSDTEEQAVRRMFHIFSQGVQTLTKEVTSPTVETLIEALIKDVPYLRKTEILRYTSSWKATDIQPYKDFEVVFQNATVRLQRKHGKWVWIYELT